MPGEKGGDLPSFVIKRGLAECVFKRKTHSATLFIRLHPTLSPPPPVGGRRNVNTPAPPTDAALSTLCLWGMGGLAAEWAAGAYLTFSAPQLVRHPLTHFCWEWRRVLHAGGVKAGDAGAPSRLASVSVG